MSQIKPIIETCKKCPQFSIKKNPMRDFDDILGPGNKSTPYYPDGSLYKHVFAPVDPDVNDQVICKKMGIHELFGFGIYLNDECIEIYPDAHIPDDCDFMLEYLLKKDADGTQG